MSRIAGRRLGAVLASGVLATALAFTFGLADLPDLSGLLSVSGRQSVTSYPLRFELSQTGRMKTTQPLGAAGGSEVQIASDAQDEPALVEPTRNVVDQAQRLVTAKRAAAAAGKSVLPIQFDLASLMGGSGKGAPAEAITIRKPIVRNGVELGTVEIWVEPSGSIALDTGEFARLLSTVDAPLAEYIGNSGQDRTTFKSLRVRGVVINYDPVRDRVLMDDRS